MREHWLETTCKVVGAITIVCLFLSSAVYLAHSQAAAPTPKAIPAERHEEVSRLQIAMLGKRVMLLQLESQHATTARELDAIQKQYSTLLEALRKASGAGPDCNLDEAKKWVCPQPATASGSPARTP